MDRWTIQNTTLDRWFERDRAHVGLAEAASGQELPPLPPIPLQLKPSTGLPRRAERPAGEWCRLNGVTPPPGSFQSPTANLVAPSVEEAV